MNALRIVRPLSPADQRLRELVIGPSAAGQAQTKELNRRMVDLVLERADIERVLVQTQKRIAQLQAEASRLHGALGGLAIGNALALPEGQRKQVDHVCVTVCRTLGVPLPVFTSKRRPEPVCWARFIAYSFSQQLAQVSANSLGCYFGVDHTNILHAVRRARELRESCAEFRAQYERCVVALEKEAEA